MTQNQMVAGLNKIKGFDITEYEKSKRIIEIKIKYKITIFKLLKQLIKPSEDNNRKA